MWDMGETEALGLSLMLPRMNTGGKRLGFGTQNSGADLLNLRHPKDIQVGHGSMSLGFRREMKWEVHFGRLQHIGSIYIYNYGSDLPSLQIEKRAKDRVFVKSQLRV